MIRTALPNFYTVCTRSLVYFYIAIPLYKWTRLLVRTASSLFILTTLFIIICLISPALKKIGNKYFFFNALNCIG